MVNQTVAGLILAGAALLLLAALGNLALLSILVPVSMVAGYGITRLRDNSNSPADGTRKR
jgi:hypothetical protein